MLCLFWRIQIAMCCWWLRNYIALLNLWAPACQEDEEQESGTMDSVSWTRGVTFMSLLDTCKVHRLYFSALLSWRNKVIKDTDKLQQVRVRKNDKKNKKTVLKCCEKTGESWREHCDSFKTKQETQAKARWIGVNMWKPDYLIFLKRGPNPQDEDDPSRTCDMHFQSQSIWSKSLQNISLSRFNRILRNWNFITQLSSETCC